jgi:hypothetical protein
MESNLVTNQYSLSIRISSDGFSLSVHDEKLHIISSKKIKADEGEDYSVFLQNQLPAQKEIHLNYKKIAIICESGYHTIVPEIFYKKDREKDFLKLQHPALPDNLEIFHTLFSQCENVLIFGIEQNILKTITRYFPEIQPASHLVNIASKIITEQKNQLTVWIRSGEIDCIVYKDFKIILLNKYSYQHAEDIVYHLLNIFQQLALNPNDFITEIFDEVNPQNEKLIKKYLPSVVIKSKQSAYEDYQW